MSWQRPGQQQPYNPGQAQRQWSPQQFSAPPPQGASAPYNPSYRPPATSGGYSQPYRQTQQPQWQQTTPPAQPTGYKNPPGYGTGAPSYSGQTQSQRPPPVQSTNPLGSMGYGGAQGYGPGQSQWQQQSPSQSMGGGYTNPSGGLPGSGTPPGSNQELLSWFQAVDRDQSGKISATELREALLNSNWSNFNAETCRLLIGMFDKNSDGTIDFNEFAALWKYVQEWKSCFSSFDRDGSGNIDASELQQALVSFGYRLSMDFCNLCTRVFDRTDMKTMKFDDFIQCCVMLRSLTDSFKRIDTNKAGVVNINYEQFLEMAIDNTIQ